MLILKNMSELMNVSNEFFVLSLYSIVIGLSLYVLSHVYSYFKPFVNRWRDYWLVLIILTALPITFSVIPYSIPDLSLFDLDHLQLTEMESENKSAHLSDIKSPKTNYSLSLISKITLLWLGIYLFGLLYTVSRLVIQIRLVHSIISYSKELLSLIHI